MGYRLNKIVTRTGDAGSTSLANGVRVGKDSQPIVAVGMVDQLNSVLGILAARPIAAEVRAVLARVQNDLFDLGAELTLPGKILLSPDSVAFLEQQVERFNAELPPLREFILPGGSETVAFCHFARATCRSVEREIVALENTDPVPASLRLPYLNRLSDLLFVLARALNLADGQPEVYWSSRVSRTPGAG